MTVTLNWQTLLTISALLGAVTAIFTFILKVVRWFDRQKTQDIELENLRKKHDEEVAALRGEHSAQTKQIKEEQTILTYGILACLKGLHEQGCNGPVTEAIQKIERYLNENAHK